MPDPFVTIQYVVEAESEMEHGAKYSYVVPDSSVPEPKEVIIVPGLLSALLVYSVRAKFEPFPVNNLSLTEYKVCEAELV